jgi:hypothetical protein
LKNRNDPDQTIEYARNFVWETLGDPAEDAAYALKDTKLAFERAVFGSS